MEKKDTFCEKDDDRNSKIIDLLLKGKTLDEAETECGKSDRPIPNPFCGVFFEKSRKIRFDLKRFKYDDQLQKTDSYEIFRCYDLNKEYSNHIIIGFYDHVFDFIYDRTECNYIIFDSENGHIKGLCCYSTIAGPRHGFAYEYDGRAIVDWSLRPLLLKAGIDFCKYHYYMKSAADMFCEADVKEFANRVLFSNICHAKANSVSLNHKTRKQTIGVIGQFNYGRSTLLNVLLGKELIPADILPTTEKATRITYASFPCASYVSHDGAETEIQIGDIDKYITSNCNESWVPDTDIDEVIVKYPCKYCEDDIDFMELPGYGWDEKNDQAADAKLHELDAAIFLLSVNAPLWKTDVNLIYKLLESIGIKRILFVLNLGYRYLENEAISKIVTAIKAKTSQIIRDYCEVRYGTQEILNEALKDLRIAVVPMPPLGQMGDNLYDGGPECNREMLKEFEVELNLLKQRMRSDEWEEHPEC